jgi:phosphate transport system substrate-binding protein
MNKSAARKLLHLCASILLVNIVGLLPAHGQASISLVGAGSTVPLPLYNEWSQQYNKVHGSAEMRYQPLGTTEGIKLVSGSRDDLGKSDFGAGEVLLTDAERGHGKLVELPVVMIGIVPAYNLPGVRQELKFTGDLLAQIFLGRVKSWDAPSIAKLNPGITLPSLPIKVVYRPGGKGTNYVLTDFLSRTSSEFRAQIGRSASPKWPTGTPAERSSDMVEKIKGEAGSIGYVELQYAMGGNLQMGLVQNAVGKFVKASSETISAACKAVEAPQWNKFDVSLINAPGADSYPITSFSWIYVRSISSNPIRRAALSDLLHWIFTTGQTIAEKHGYSELPAPLRENVIAKAASLR